MTPEGKVKEKIKEILDEHKPFLYYYMPVPYGYGAATVDFLVCAYGHFIAIEAKRAGKSPTTRQDGVMDDIAAAHGTSLAIDGQKGYDFLTALLNRLRMIAEIEPL